MLPPKILLSYVDFLYNSEGLRRRTFHRTARGSPITILKIRSFYRVSSSHKTQAGIFSSTSPSHCFLPQALDFWFFLPSLHWSSEIFYIMQSHFSLVRALTLQVYTHPLKEVVQWVWLVGEIGRWLNYKIWTTVTWILIIYFTYQKGRRKEKGKKERRKRVGRRKNWACFWYFYLCLKY